jgi:glutaredoxin 3
MSARVTVYVASYCSYCEAAKRMLGAMSVPYEAIDVSTDHEKRMWLVEKTGMRTVPQIFVGEKPIGGFTDMRALHQKGGFVPLLDAAGIAHA